MEPLSYRHDRLLRSVADLSDCAARPEGVLSGDVLLEVLGRDFCRSEFGEAVLELEAAGYISAVIYRPDRWQRGVCEWFLALTDKGRDYVGQVGAVTRPTGDSVFRRFLMSKLGRARRADRRDEEDAL